MASGGVLEERISALEGGVGAIATASGNAIQMDGSGSLDVSGGSLDVDTTSNVVDVYVRYLRNKLEEADEPRVIHTIRGAGYVMRAE